MAMVVAAVLSAAFLGVQRHSMRLTEINLGIWDTINLSQEILMSRNPKDLTPLPAWAVWPPTPGGRFRINRGRFLGSSYLEQYQLEVETSNYALTWEWLKILPLPKIDPNKRKPDVIF